MTSHWFPSTTLAPFNWLSLELKKWTSWDTRRVTSLLETLPSLLIAPWLESTGITKSYHGWPYFLISPGQSSFSFVVKINSYSQLTVFTASLTLRNITVWTSNNMVVQAMRPPWATQAIPVASFPPFLTMWWPNDHVSGHFKLFPKVELVLSCSSCLGHSPAPFSCGQLLRPQLKGSHPLNMSLQCRLSFQSLSFIYLLFISIIRIKSPRGQGSPSSFCC